jgi:hemolysin D
MILTLRLQATLDLLQAAMPPSSASSGKSARNSTRRHRLPHEAAFLPAALELQETPVSPAPRIVAWLLMAFALIALMWAIFGPYRCGRHRRRARSCPTPAAS